MFADDTNIFVSDKLETKVYEKANNLLHELQMYMISNLLHINYDKCVYMHFKPHINNENRKTCARSRIISNEPQLKINGIKLKKTDRARFLGVIIDENLNWDHHLNYLEEKLNSCIITVKRVKKFIPEDHYKKVYHSLFASHLTYGITAWGCAGTSKLDKVFSIQKRCIRLLFGKKYSFDHAEFYQTCARVRTYSEHIAPKDYTLEHTKSIFKSNSLLTVHNLHKLYTINEVFKIMKFKIPISLSEYYKTVNHPSLFKNHVVIPKYKKQKSRKQFLYQSTKLWNKYTM